MTEEAKKLGNQKSYPHIGWDLSSGEEKVVIFSYDDSGLTKREYYAGLAMQAIITNCGTLDNYSGYAIKCADALLEELSKTE